MPFANTSKRGYSPTVWKGNIIKVRSLLSTRKYRRCAILCEQLLEQAECPTQRVFVLFYQALSYEALGLIAHKYSSNKIPLLEQAKDAFFAAAEEVRLLAKMKPVDSHNHFLGSSSPEFDISLSQNDSTRYLAPSASSSVNGNEKEIKQNPVIARNSGSTVITLSNPSTFEWNIFESCMPSVDHEIDQDEDDVANLTPLDGDRESFVKRLSQSLSLDHILVGDLLPSPLFNQASEAISYPQASDITSKHAGSSEKPLPITPINRPLPELPFKHQHNFEIRGNRIFQVPKQSVALQKLVSKYECSPKQHENRNSMSPLAGKTPTTERFRMISAYFEEKNDPQIETFTDTSAALLPVNTPCPKRPRPLPALQKSSFQHNAQPKLSLPLASTSTTNYAAALTAFQKSLTTHLIPAITATIAKARQIQLDHENERRIRFQQSRSANRSTDISSGQAEGVRLASFWSFRAAVAQAESEEGEEALKKRKLRDRIARLKRDGWTGVRAEAKGFKGGEYYASLRAKVEREMAGCRFRGSCYEGE